MIGELFAKRPALMGIVNVTPDSFSDGGEYFDPDRAIEHGLQLLKEGADILDIGGESTRPGAEEISTGEEIRRVAPVIRELARHTKYISIDSYRPETQEAALNAGATILNDVTALANPASMKLAAATNAPVCLMHMQGSPRTMQRNPFYEDVVEEIFAYLQGRIDACMSAGIKKENIIADVGIGFGKTLEHNLELLNKLDRFAALDVPLLLGVSRKSFIAKISDSAAASDNRLPGSLAAALWGIQKGATILRVHDVAATKQALDVWDSMARRP